MEEISIQAEASTNAEDGFRKDSVDEEESSVIGDDVLVDDFSDGENDSSEQESGTHHRFDGISNENFVRLVWRLGYQLNSKTMKWTKEN